MLKQVHEFVGGLRAALQTLEAASNDGGLAAEVSKLQVEERELRAALHTKNESGRLEAALQALSAHIAIYALIIGVEKPNELVRLDPTNLTVFRISADGRRDYLWEIGSGANWLGYHL